MLLTEKGKVVECWAVRGGSLSTEQRSAEARLDKKAEV